MDPKDQRLVMALEYVWKKSAFGNEALDREKVLNFCRQIKEGAATICNVCQAQPEYQRWQQSRKRALNDGLAVSSHNNLTDG